MLEDNFKAYLGNPVTGFGSDSFYNSLHKYNLHTHQKAFAKNFFAYGLEVGYELVDVYHNGETRSEIFSQAATIEILTSSYLQLTSACLDSLNDCTFIFRNRNTNSTVTVPHITCVSGEPRLVFSRDAYAGMTVARPESLLQVVTLVEDEIYPLLFLGNLNTTSITITKLSLISIGEVSSGTISLDVYDGALSPANLVKNFGVFSCGSTLSNLEFTINSLDNNFFTPCNPSSILTVTSQEAVKIALGLNYFLTF